MNIADLSAIKEGNRGACPNPYLDKKHWGWHRMVLDAWREHVARTEKTRVLEIGAFDGVSANLMLDFIFPHPESAVHTIDAFLPDLTTPEVTSETKEIFEENCRRGGYGDRIQLYVGLSVEVLAWMIAGEGFWESFDVVYIDGSHLAKDVLSDAAQSWPLLKPGGLMVFDDYEWGLGKPAWQRPREAIEAFESLCGPFLAPVWKGYQWMFRKVD